MAFYVHKDGSNDPAAPPPSTRRDDLEHKQGNPQPHLLPNGHPNANIPVVVWQYYGDYPRERLPGRSIRKGDVDLQLVNPAYENLVLSSTIPAPSALS